tara:strand:+ start:2452 stop:3177 length:726 start_codon:yes stop_codon:yes gene_type:complete
MKKILICFIGTGDYLNFLPNYYNKIMENLCPDCEKDLLVLTDGEVNDLPDNIIHVHTDHKEWPYITLERFKIIDESSKLIKNYDWFLFLDADTIVNQTVEYDEIFDDSKDYIGVHHPCHFMKWPPHTERYGSFDTTNSRASVDDSDDLSIYWQGCLWGGKVPQVLNLISELKNRVDLDLKDDIIALWHDESHLNKFFIENKLRVNTLSPSFAYPEEYDSDAKEFFESKIVHLSKNNSKFHS